MFIGGRAFQKSWKPILKRISCTEDLEMMICWTAVMVIMTIVVLLTVMMVDGEEEMKEGG